MSSPEEFRAEIDRLQTENARLMALLDSHGIPWKPPTEKPPVPLPQKEQSVPLSTDGKVTLFRRRFQGRTDVYPIRWERYEKTRKRPLTRCSGTTPAFSALRRLSAKPSPPPV